MKKLLSIILFSFLLLSQSAFPNTTEETETDVDSSTTEVVENNNQNPSAGVPGSQRNRGNSGNTNAPGLSRATLKELGDRAIAARSEYHEAMRQYLMSMPDITAEEEAVARAEFLRVNFDWGVEVALLEQEYAEARAAHEVGEASEHAIAQVEEIVEGMRAAARSAGERREAEAYRRAAAALIAAEQQAAGDPDQ